MTTYETACQQLPADAAWSSSFGYPGMGGYVEYYRTPEGKRFKIANGSWEETAPFNWTFQQVKA